MSRKRRWSGTMRGFTSLDGRVESLVTFFFLHTTFLPAFGMTKHVCFFFFPFLFPVHSSRFTR